MTSGVHKDNGLHLKQDQVETIIFVNTESWLILILDLKFNLNL